MATIERSGDVLLQVRNHHSAEAGTPPSVIDVNLGQYVGYFENRFGEQSVFVFDHGTRTASLYMGDAGWETAHAVNDGLVPDLVLGEAELLWLRACWQAATGKA